MSVSCNPTALARLARCFRSLNGRQLAAARASLICGWSQNVTPPPVSLITWSPDTVGGTYNGGIPFADLAAFRAIDPTTVTELTFSVGIDPVAMDSISNIQTLTALTDLTFNTEAIGALDVSGMTTLVNLAAFQCTGLASINLSGCTGLTTLNVSRCFSLAALNVTDCTPLQSLDISQATGLVSLTGLQNKTALDTLTMNSASSLTVLDVTGCTLLTFINFNTNTALAVITISGSSLTSLATNLASTPVLTTVNALSCPSLSAINIQNIPTLTSVAFTNCTDLSNVNLSGNNIASIDCSGCNNLTTISAANNAPLASLTFPDSWNNDNDIDFSNCTSLVNFAFTPGTVIQDSGQQILFPGCALNQASVSNALIFMDSFGTLTSLTISFIGGTNAPPNAAGLIAKNNLQVNGCMVATN